MSENERFDRFILTSANLLIETNIYKDRHLSVAPQHERLPAMIDAFRWINLEEGTRDSINVIGLQELQIDADRHNGETITKELDYDFGIWSPHSRQPAGEHIGALSSIQPNNDDAEILTLDKNRHAIALKFGEFCVCIAHPMYSDAKRRAQQIDALIEYVSDKPYSALMGDFNEEPLPWTTRKKLGSIGMESAFVRNHKGHPVTLPTPEYRQYRSLPRRIGFSVLGGGLRYDDIYISDAMKVNSTGTIDSDSDHRFVYASVSTPHGIFMERTLT